MNVSDAEKELARLKKNIIRLESDIGEKTFKSDVLKERLLQANKEYEALQKKIGEVDIRFAGEKYKSEIDRMSELEKNIKSWSAEIEKLDESIDRSNISLEFTKERYGEIAAEAERLRESDGADNEQLEAISREAAEVNKKLHELAEKYADLAEQKEIFDPSEKEFLALRQEIKECVLYLDQLAERGKLAELSSGAEIAEDRIADLSNTIAEYEDRLENFDLTDEQRDTLTAKVERGKKLLEEYQNILDKVAEKEAEPGDTQADEKADAQARLNTYLEKSSSLYQKISGMLGKTTEMSGVLKDMASVTSGELSGAFSSAGTALGGFSAELTTALASAGPYIAAAVVAVKALQKVWQSVKQFGQTATSSMVNGVKSIASFAFTAGSGLASAVKSIGKFGASAIKTIGTLSKKIAAFAKRFNVFSKMTETLTEKIGKLGSMIKRVFVFSVITSGLRAIRTQMSAYLQVNSEFMTALRRLQGVLLTAFQPIYEVIVPALTTLINVLTHAAATIAQFFASLFGTTAKRAQANAEALYNQATATTAAGDAAEEAAKQLAGFDEINKLEGNKTSGGGGATSVDMGPLFDYEYDETPFDSWGEAFSAFLDKLLDGIPKLREAFKNFADWLNGLSKNLYDMFTFPGVLEKVKLLGKELADALNDLVNWIDWDMLGRALGAGLNLALNFLTSFLYEFDWMNLGRKLAEFVNGLVDEIDWYEFGRLMWAGFKIGLETLAGFITGLNMTMMAEAASNTVLGFFDEMKNTIDRIPWGEIGQQIAAYLNNIHWYDIITHAWDAISAAINAVFTMARNFIDTLRWGEIAEQIYTAVNDSMGKIKWGEIGKTIGDAFKNAFNFVKTIIANIRWHELGENIAEFILSFDIVSALGSLADMIAAGINAAVQVACGMLDKIMPVAFDIARGIAERIKNAIQSVDWEKMGEVVGNGIKTALSFVAGLLDPAMFYEIGKAIGDFLVNLDWPGIIGGLAEVLANAIASAVAGIRGFLDSVQPHLKEIAEGIAQKINDFVESVDWKELGKTINEGINTALDFLLDILDQLDWDAIGDAIADFFINLDWGSLMEKWGTVVGKAMGNAVRAIDLGDLLWLGGSMVTGMISGWLNKWDESGGIIGWLERSLFKPFIEGFTSLFGIHSPSTVMAELGTFLVSGLLQGITETWETITGFFSTAFESIKQTVTDAWENIKTVTSTAWENIKTTLSTVWDGLKESASTAFSNIKEKIQETWDNIKEKTSSAWENIKSTLSQTWENLKTTAESAFSSIKEKITTAWETLKSDTSTKWSEIKTALLNTWTELKENASNKFQEIKQSIIDKMGELKNHDWAGIGKSIVDGILNGLQSIWNSLTSWVKSVKDTISDALSGAGGSSRSGGFGTSNTGGGGMSRISVQSMPDMGNFEIPALAKGAVIPPNREFMAILGDQKRGTNVEAPLSTIEQAVANVFARMNGGSNRSQTVVLEVDGREFGRAVVDFGGNEYQRIGVRLVEAHT